MSAADPAPMEAEEASPVEDEAPLPLPPVDEDLPPDLPEGQEGDPLDESTFFQRARAVLLAPWAAFEHHDPGWGWIKPWIALSLAGMLFGLVVLVMVDLDALVEKQQEHMLDNMSERQQKELDDPEKQEQLKKVFRMQAFFIKVWLVVGPPIGGLIGILITGLLLFAATRALGSQPVNLMRCISVSAWASLVDATGYLAKAIGVVLGSGSPQVQTSLASLVDPMANPVLHAAFGRIDPFLVVYYVVLAAGLQASCRLPRGRAILVVVTFFGIGTLLALAGGAAAGMRAGGG